MNQPLVYQLFCQEHRWVATLGCDKSWKHLSSKPTLRWTFPEVPSKTSWLIGWVCNGCKPFSWPVLIERLAYFKQFSLVYYLIKHIGLCLISVYLYRYKYEMKKMLPWKNFSFFKYLKTLALHSQNHNLSVKSLFKSF